MLKCTAFRKGACAIGKKVQLPWAQRMGARQRLSDRPCLTAQDKYKSLLDYFKIK